jgi:DNA modification methylase
LVKTNALYYGDNLDILRRYIPDEGADLVYLDPPFNSNRDYNVIFKDESGRKSDAQILAFEDTWHWGPSAEATYDYLTNSSRHGGRIPDSVSRIVSALRAGIGTNQMLAYIVEMAPRLVELRRVLKPTGSLYLHCDPTASHYLKLVLDAIFGPRSFVNEIVWERSTAKNDPKRYGRIHDVLLFYSKGSTFTWNRQNVPFNADFAELPANLSKNYTYVEPGTGRRYRLSDLTANKPGGDTDYEWRGVRPYKGRHWAFSKANLEKFEAEGRIVYRRTGMPTFKRYLDEMPGVPLQDVWTDIRLGSASPERLGWDTQKPLALLERIVTASSNPGDVVLDPFCGCGTALVAAQKLGREWVGIDITYLSIAVMRARMKDSFGLEDVEVIGQPTEVEGARALAQSPEGRYQFQWWALALVDAQPVGGAQRKGADQGIDGTITFTDKNNELERVLVSVKSGHVNSSMIRDLKGTLDREKAAIGIFLTLEEATEPMRLEAATAGAYHSALWNRDYQRIQILSIRDLLEEAKKPSLPPFVLPTYQQAERVKRADNSQQELFG